MKLISHFLKHRNSLKIRKIELILETQVTKCLVELFKRLGIRSKKILVKSPGPWLRTPLVQHI